MKGRFGLPFLHAAIICELAALFFCTAALAGAANAQEGKAGSQRATVRATPPGPAPASTTSAGVESRQPARRPTIRRAGRTSDFPMDPNAKWACDQQTAVAEPAWRGSQERLSFTFHIRNAGTDNLRIRAKGG